jgi:hypothetical protein
MCVLARKLHRGFASAAFDDDVEGWCGTRLR